MSKTDTIVADMNKLFDEREGEITALLLAALSGEHVALIGQEAVDDDSVIVSVGACVEGGEVGRYMLSSSTSPDEISKLRSKTGFTILSEIFNAQSQVMNAVMEMIRDGTKNTNVICGTSKSVPNEDDDLFALYSAMLFRQVVRPVSDNGAFLNKISSSKTGSVQKISAKDIEDIRKTAAGLKVDDQVLAAVLSIREDLDRKGNFVSDIRWKKAMDALKVAAAASGKKSVDVSLIPILQHILWDRPEQRKDVRNTIFGMCTPKSVDVTDLHKDAAELLKQVVASKGALDENAGFPRVVYCYDCSESFANLKRLKAHSQSNPRHTYADPNEAQSKSHTYKRYNYSDLVTLFTTKYRWEIFKDSDPSIKEAFKKEAAELRKRRTVFSQSLDKDRSELMKGIDGNAWLSALDKDDLIAAFDGRGTILNEIESLISDAETMLE